MKQYGKSKVNKLLNRYSLPKDLVNEEEQFVSQYTLNLQYRKLKQANEDSSSTLNEKLTALPQKVSSRKLQRLSELEASNLYNSLNVSETASLEEIKLAYKRLCILKHPDKGGKAEEFLNLTEAYQILSLPLTRSIYDAFGSRSLSLIHSVILHNKLGNINEDEVKESIQQGDLETIALIFKVKGNYYS